MSATEYQGTDLFHTLLDHAGGDRRLTLTQRKSVEPTSHSTVLSKLKQSAGRILKMKNEKIIHQSALEQRPNKVSRQNYRHEIS